MKVLVTGASGFVGSHSAAALQQAGHELRLIARAPDALRAHFAQLGLQAPEVVQADMQDASAMRLALQGCDAVLHAGAAVNLDGRQARVARGKQGRVSARNRARVVSVNQRIGAVFHDAAV